MNMWEDIERTYSLHRPLKVQGKLMQRHLIYMRSFPRQEVFKVLFPCTVILNPSLAHRQANYWESSEVSVTTPAVSQNKYQLKKAWEVETEESYRDIAGGGKGREHQLSTSKAIVDMDCMEGFSSAGSLTGLSGESSSTSVIVVIWTTRDRYSF